LDEKNEITIPDEIWTKIRNLHEIGDFGGRKMTFWTRYFLCPYRHAGGTVEH